MPVEVVPIDMPADGQWPDVRIRQELARELHDGVAQMLTTMLLELEMFRREQYGRTSVQTAVDGFKQSTSTVLNTLRELVYELRSQRVAETELTSQIAGVLATCEQRYGLETRLAVSEGWPAVVSAPAAAHLLRIVEEAVRNSAAHSRGGSVAVTLATDGDGGAEISIADDGVGVAPSSLVEGAGFGVIGMRERALLVGGQLSVESMPGRGTTIRLRVPLASIIMG